jgi:ribonuclease P protein component
LQRLKTRSQFQAVLAGSTAARTPHFALHCAALDAATPKLDAAASKNMSDQMLFAVRDVWLGAMVPKRWAKRAVTRNAIKRQIYSVSTDFQSTLPVAAHVVRLRAGFDQTQFGSASSEALKVAIRLELRQLLARAATRLPTATLQCGGS